MTDDSQFFRLQELLSEMQMELACREWTENQWDRCARAGKLRSDLWDAIAAYRDFYSPSTKVTP